MDVQDLHPAIQRGRRCRPLGVLGLDELLCLLQLQHSPFQVESLLCRRNGRLHRPVLDVLGATFQAGDPFLLLADHIHPGAAIPELLQLLLSGAQRKVLPRRVHREQALGEPLPRLLQVQQGFRHLLLGPEATDCQLAGLVLQSDALLLDLQTTLGQLVLTLGRLHAGP